MKAQATETSCLARLDWPDPPLSLAPTSGNIQAQQQELGRVVEPAPTLHVHSEPSPPSEGLPHLASPPTLSGLAVSPTGVCWIWGQGQWKVQLTEGPRKVGVTVGCTQPIHPFL